MACPGRELPPEVTTDPQIPPRSSPSCCPRRYWLFRSWGRVGTVIGSNKLEQMPSKEDAVEHFMKLYEEKTGNAWHSENFTKYPKKFYPLEIDYGQVIGKLLHHLVSVKGRVTLHF